VERAGSETTAGSAILDPFVTPCALFLLKTKDRGGFCRADGEPHRGWSATLKMTG
jgi:hypothetical protein